MTDASPALRRAPLLLVAIALLSAVLAPAPPLVSQPAVSPDFVHFESAHVHPLALTPGGGRLLAVNTPDNRLVVFDLSGAAPRKIADIPVGLEPVSVAALDDSTAWVVNQLSDDVSVVNLNTLHVRATIRVGDEPSDVVFAAGAAYVSVSQEDVVKRYSTTTLAPLGAPIAIGARMPRALARSADGAFVYVAGFFAGNRTSALPESLARDSLPAPNPPMGGSLPPAPRVGLIIQQQGSDWRDESGKLWNSKARYTALDQDVSQIATATNTVARTFGALSTVNFGLAVAPDGRVALTGTEARNLIRFEPNLRGHLVDTRLAILTAAGAASSIGLEPHVDYAVPEGSAAERESSLAIPTGVAWSPDGQRAYVTALGSAKLAVVNPAAGVLARVPTVDGPTGVVADAARGRLYVLGRYHGELQTLSAGSLGEIARARLGFDPTPDAIVNGRKFFYGGFTSGHGDQACATCHVFGDFDNIAWDLGDPRGVYLPKPPGMLDPNLEGFHPMKGPMTTQTLRGLPGTGVLHWRGDRADLAAFNGAFVSLMGRGTSLPDSEMSAFSDFTLALAHPPNPNEYLDRTLRTAPTGQPSAQRGRNLFFSVPLDGPLRCNDCHSTGTPTTPFGQPGTNGQIIDDTALLEDQDIKVPQLRNLYRKTGFTRAVGAFAKRGFGYIHDGSVATLFEFLAFPGFTFGTGTAADNNRRDVEAFLLSFDTGMAPAVGYQLTVASAADNNLTTGARLDTLKGQADLGYCDLVAKGRIGATPRGWTYQGADAWKSDRAAESAITSAQLLGLGGLGSEVTVTGVPKGGGRRIGIDRDRDGSLDGDELDAGSDPGNPLSTPANVGVEGAGDRAAFALRAIGPNPFRDGTEVRFTLGARSRVDVRVFDVLGREVRRLADGLWLDPGAHALRWDGRDRGGAPAGAGVYFVRVRSDYGAATRAVVRVR